MAVYVDDMYKYPIGQYRGMKMSHLWADTLEELFVMVDLIRVQRKWLQGHQTLSLPQYRSASWVHFDIALSKRVLAVQAGAVEMLYRELPAWLKSHGGGIPRV